MAKILQIICLSSDKFPPFRVDVKVLLGKEMSRRGHKIDFLLQPESADTKPGKTKWMDQTVYVGKTNTGTYFFQRLLKHYFSITHDLKLFPLCFKNSYNFIQVKDKFVAAMFALICGKLTNSKVIFWLSYPFPEASLYAYETGIARYPLLYLIRGITLKFLLYKIILRFSHHIFVQSEQMKLDISLAGIQPEKMTAIPMGIDLEEIDELIGSNSVSVAEEQGSIVYLGTLNRARKLDFLIYVFEKVLTTVPDSHLYMVGGGNDESDIELLVNIARKIGILDKITFTGHLKRSHAIRYVQQSQICLSPFLPIPILNSTSPTKLVEYMSFGKAVVANTHPEQEIIINSSNCGFCVPYTVDSFAAAIVSLLKDPELSTRMGANGRKYVEQYRDYKIIAENLENSYLRLLDR